MGRSAAQHLITDSKVSKVSKAPKNIRQESRRSNLPLNRSISAPSILAASSSAFTSRMGAAGIDSATAGKAVSVCGTPISILATGGLSAPPSVPPGAPAFFFLLLLFFPPPPPPPCLAMGSGGRTDRPATPPTRGRSRGANPSAIPAAARPKRARRAALDGTDDAGATAA